MMRSVNFRARMTRASLRSEGRRSNQVSRFPGARAQKAADAGVREASLSERIFMDIETRQQEAQAGGAGGATTRAALHRLDDLWLKLRSAGTTDTQVPSFVTESAAKLDASLDFDVMVCGGTLGIFVATALQLQGLKVAVIERGSLCGRAQEWNISRGELRVLADMGVLSDTDIEESIAVEFNPVRMGFKGGDPVWTKDVLNLGVKPTILIEAAARIFKQSGGVVIEGAAASGAVVHPNGVALKLAGNSGSLESAGINQECQITSKLLLDCMGHSSPITRQYRAGTRPDGVCCVVGSLASGFPPEKNSFSDLIYTDSDILESPSHPGHNLQYFWEAFPSGAGPSHRTTYMFAYMDADPSRPSLQSMLEDYWRLMPEYQGVELSSIQPERVLFGFFPTYRDSPLKAKFDRVLAVGDASGIQSPLSFGGFGALTRHIPRLVPAIQEAVQADLLQRDMLQLVNAYNPGLSSSWMLQRAMSVRVTGKPSPNLINRILASNFTSMARGGDSYMRPFLQDVMKWGPFAGTVLGQMRRDPLVLPEMFQHVGVAALLDWFKHFVALGFYEVGYELFSPLLLRMASEQQDPATAFRLRRWSDAMEYGSGRDYKH